MARETSFVYTEPRDIDGTPYEAAGATVDQTVSLMRLLQRALDDTWALARIAQMEREEEPDGGAFEAHPISVKIGSLQEVVASLIKATDGPIKQAIIYDPLNPPKDATIDPR